jgi:hypothetical protein
VAEVRLTQGQVALVDPEDHQRVVEAGPWHLIRRPDTPDYAARNVRVGSGRRTTERMHNFITGWRLVDHQNHDGLDNRKENLRLATSAQNMYNKRPQRGGSSQFKGVYWDKQRSKWRARLSINYKTKHLGSFDTELDAALAYDSAARQHFGEYACLNFKPARPMGSCDARL